MFLNRRLVLISLHCYFTIFCESKPLSRKNTHLFSLLGYLHGYKIGHDYAFQLSPIVPVIVLPIINQQQTVSILKTANDNKFQENENNIQTALPAKLISMNSTDLNNEYEDKEVVKQSTKRDSPDLKLSSDVIEELDTSRQADNTVNINVTSNGNTAIETSTVQIQNVTETTLQLNVTEVSSNRTISNATENPVSGYATAMYNNEFVTSIQLTTDVNEVTGLPPMDDNRWQNFTNNKNNTQGSGNQSTATERGGPYSAALYDYGLINNLKFTTEVYEKDQFLPPIPDERWKNFSSDTLDKNSGQFRPLAGLYYDGFLHRPLKKVNFVPNYLI